MRLWFYVPDYPTVETRLEHAMRDHGVARWSVEPAGVAGSGTDADVTVEGEPWPVVQFFEWLESSGIEGLRIEGEEVPCVSR